MTNKEILSHIDATLLKAISTWEEMKRLCEEAVKAGAASVCIPPCFVKRVKETFPELNICTVIGFPLGYNTREIKVQETRQAIAQGAGEVDMVVNLGDVKAGSFDLVTEEIRALKEEAKDCILKVIVETCYLTEEEKKALCRCVTEAGADYIKTSTGFGTAGAKLEDVAIFKENIGPQVKIKAAGGIRSKEEMEAFLEAGCERIGSSSIGMLI